MKNFLKLFLILIFYSFPTNASEFQESLDTENEDWENIVDFVNSKITFLYISELVDNGSLTSKEIEVFETFKSELDNSNLSNIIPYNDLKSYLEPHFGKTLENISSPIDSLKEEKNLNIESLFTKVTDILVKRKSEVQDSNQFQELKESIAQPVEKEEVQNIEEPIENKNLPEGKSGESKFISYSTLLSLAILFLVTTIFFISVWLHVKSENNKNKKIIKGQENKLRNKDWELKRTTANTTRTETRTRNTNENSKPESKASQIKPKSNQIEEQKSPEIELLLPTTTPEKKSDHLYAGKPTEEKVLKEISSELDPQQTIFKLNILPNNSEVAEFEVFHVSNFMTRSITNSPDDYLYRVCNHENSNQEFRKEILTVKKGVANLIGGEWVVKEENKATIKFQ